MSSKSKKLALWRKHTADALEIALRDDSDDSNIVNNSGDDSMVYSTELDAS